jgi:nucleoside-diphosphate-sugar epimerase
MREWLRNQSFCVTGGAGALGQALIRKLAEQGAERIVVIDPCGHSSLTGEDRDAPVRFMEGSILDPSHMERATEGCTVLFHLAALTHAGRSASDPGSYVAVNCTGTAKVMEACRAQGVRNVIYTSTGHVYGRPNAIPVGEDHTVSPLSVYAASKLAGEAFVQAYASSFGFAAVIARMANLYGPFSSTDTVIGTSLEQAMRGSAIHVRNLKAVRDFLFIDDAAEALIRLVAAAKDRQGPQVVNVSSGTGISVEEICTLLADLAERQGIGRPGIRQDVRDPEEQVPTFVLDNTRLERLTGWVPGTTMAEGLETVFHKRLRG